MTAIRQAARAVMAVLLLLFMVVALAVAIFSIGGGTSAVSLPALAGYLRLPELRDTTGDWLAGLEADGPVAWWSVLAGGIVLAVGLIVLLGYFGPRRERTVVMEDDPAGRLAALPRPLARIAKALAEQEQGVVEARTRVRPRRFWQSGLAVLVTRPRSASASEVEGRAGDALEPLAEAFNLETRVRSRLGPRVE